MDGGRRTPVLQWLGIQIAQIGLLCLLFAVFFGFAMVFFWHANDAWPHWSALDMGWSPPAVVQPRVSKFVTIAYQVPIGAVAALAGLLMTSIGVSLTRR